MKFFAKKSLGQNFLKSESALNTIIEEAKIQNSELILEIGPGQGALTEKLLKTGGQIIAVEKDRELCDFLKQKFQSEIANKQLEIIEHDILEFEITEKLEQLQKENYKLIANIPYYITGAIIRKFLEASKSPNKMVLLIQKEVAERIITQNQKESILSLSVKAYGTPRVSKIVKAGSFSPRPKVDSAIFVIDNISKKHFIENGIPEKMFFEILHAGFGHKRKVLIKNLKQIVENRGKKIEDVWAATNLHPQIRAEDLNLETWLKLSKEITN